MSTILTLYIVVVIIVLVAVWFLVSLRLSNKRKKLNEIILKKELEKADNTKYLISIRDVVKSKVQSFVLLTSYESGFASGYKIFEWKTAYLDCQQLKTEKLNNFDNSNLSDDDKALFRKFLEIESNYNDILTNYNDEFLAHELQINDYFLSDVDGKSLDSQQRLAVLSDEDNVLVIAGAGSGKTATIAGKVAYLVRKKGIQPKDILLISFTRKSCEEMQERIKNKMNINVDVKTFNKLGLDIIREVDGIDQKNVCGLSDTELKQIFQSFFESHLKDPSYLHKFTEYFLYSSKPYRDANSFPSSQEYSTYLKDSNPVGYKKIIKKDKDGVQYSYREKLKSFEEVAIANFLFFNRIEYEYESGYKVKTASEKFGQYKPDFFLPEYNIYIEHFGIDREGNVPAWFKGDRNQTAKEKYNNGIEWKRKLHAENSTILVETYSYQKKEGNILSLLRDKLLSLGVRFQPFTPGEILDTIRYSDKFELNQFTKLIITFANLFKSNRLEIKTFESYLREKDDTRTLQFFELFKPIYYSYQSFLEDRNEIDFTDMINIATDYIREKKYSKEYQYIIIDEFQDISIGRFHLIKSILDLTPTTKLFCVGDDWQSIYRFSGSDISILTQFDKYFSTTIIEGFARVSQILRIENTYRFKKDLIEHSSRFILKNDSQLEKKLIAVRPNNEKNSLQFISAPDERSIPDALYDELFKLKVQLDRNFEDINDKTIIFLGRYNHDIYMLGNSQKFCLSFNKTTQTKVVSVTEIGIKSIPYLTVHSAKGIEADFVFVLNVNSGKHGFPSQVADDPVLLHLLSHSDQYPNSEERRLFYVALTRCKEQVYLLTQQDNESSFFKEMTGDQSDNLVCPWCGIGQLIIKESQYGFYNSCDNYNFCNYMGKINISDLVEKAIQLRKQKKNKRAIELLELSHDISPYSFDIYSELGQAYFNEDLYEKAIDNFKISYFNFNNKDILKQLSTSYYFLEKYEEALEYTYEYQRHFPDDTSIFYNIGNYKFALKLYEDALSNYEKALKNDFMDNAEIHNGIVECCSQLDNYKKALEIFDSLKFSGYSVDEMLYQRIQAAAFEF